MSISTKINQLHSNSRSKEPLVGKDKLILDRIITIKVVKMDLDEINAGIKLFEEISAESRSNFWVMYHYKRLLNGRGTIYLNKKEYDKAIADFKLVLGHGVHIETEFDIYALDGRAKALEARGELDEALIDLSILLQLQLHGQVDSSIVDLEGIAEKVEQVRGKLGKTKTEAHWRKLSTTGSKVGRFFHSTVLNPSTDEMIVYGGRTSFDYEETSYSWDVYILNLVNNSWKRKKCSGPKVRSCGHSAVVYNGKMYVLGGESEELLDLEPKRDAFDRVFRCLDLTTYRWTNLRYSAKLKNIRKHTATRWKHQMIVFGGEVYCDNDSWTSWNGMYIFDFNTEKWNIVHYNCNGSKVPCKRDLHAAWVIKDRFYVFGGEDYDRNSNTLHANYLNDMYVMDLETKQWLGEVKFKKPAPRGELQAAVLNKHLAFLFGGYGK